MTRVLGGGTGGISVDQLETYLEMLYEDAIEVINFHIPHMDTPYDTAQQRCRV